MTQAIDLIKRAMRLNKVIGVGETPSSDDVSDMLEALNAMLESWALNRLLVYVNSTDTVSISSASHTVGPSGATVSTRPVKVDDSSYITYSGLDYPLTLIDQDHYNDISLKAKTGIPRYLFVDTTMPNATLYFYPAPVSSMTLVLKSQKVLMSFATMSTDVSLPPGYSNAIAYSLAEDTAPEYGIQTSRDISRKASIYRKAIKRINSSVPVLDMPSELQRYQFNATTGN